MTETIPLKITKRVYALSKKQVYWSLSFLFSFFGFYLIEHLFTVKPNVISGNGNLGILIIFLCTPVFISSWVYTVKLAKASLLKNNKI
ncbi:hypothetical protein KIS1582_0964 [Cytobacillus firmus]|uniref:DUF485 domain-containing protein n=1 Tax=Cytobacillus firmus TaxID=1399 RepID=A0A380XQE1_CYTFI|nr:hypothetical protein KIS1582_0964 [Cytobacillus firmus]SUV05601.1 Uncharacterised protein [Cytobacillus firmus]